MSVRRDGEKGGRTVSNIGFQEHFSPYIVGLEALAMLVNGCHRAALCKREVFERGVPVFNRATLCSFRDPPITYIL